jgi:penicillin-binding protein 2
MAMVAATIANGGRLYRPRLVEKWSTGPDQDYKVNPSWAIHQIDVPMNALELVRGGMFDVVMDEDGTAKKTRVGDIPIAGKTGTAQYRKRVDDKVINSAYTWMISYAPYDAPRYAVAMLVEDGVSGGSTIGPRLSHLYDQLFHYDGTLRGKEES